MEIDMEHLQTSALNRDPSACSIPHFGDSHLYTFHFDGRLQTGILHCIVKEIRKCLCNEILDYQKARVVEHLGEVISSTIMFFPPSAACGWKSFAKLIANRRGSTRSGFSRN